MSARRGTQLVPIGIPTLCWKTGKYPDGVNQMWILKNLKNLKVLLEHPKSLTFNHITNIKYFDFSTLYTTITHDKLKNKIVIFGTPSFSKTATAVFNM